MDCNSQRESSAFYTPAQSLFRTRAAGGLGGRRFHRGKTLWEYRRRSIQPGCKAVSCRGLEAEWLTAAELAKFRCLVRLRMLRLIISWADGERQRCRK